MLTTRITGLWYQYIFSRSLDIFRYAISKIRQDDYSADFLPKSIIVQLIINLIMRLMILSEPENAWAGSNIMAAPLW